jgi:pyruvate dehydrogenase E2 component (dihydrolipoamide acetyltransferase)
VAILGVSRAEWRPVWSDGEFVPRQILPLSLSYDHRVIDGARAVRFTQHLSKVLGDVRRLLL